MCLFSIQYSQLSEWGLLTAMLALSIYIIMRLDEGPTDDNDFDYLLIAAVKVGLALMLSSWLG